MTTPTNIQLQKAVAWLDRVIGRNPHMKEARTCRAVLQAQMDMPPAEPATPVFRDLSMPIDPQIAEYELLMNATPFTTASIEHMDTEQLNELRQRLDERLNQCHEYVRMSPCVHNIQEPATLSNINLICPPGVNQTEFAGGWNDSRHYALTHGTVPPVIKGNDARAMGWNACSYLMTLGEANQHGR